MFYVIQSLNAFVKSVFLIFLLEEYSASPLTNSLTKLFLSSDNKMGDRSHHGIRGGFHRRGSMRGSRGGGSRGGRGAGFSSRGHDDNRPTSKLEEDGTLIPPLRKSVKWVMSYSICILFYLLDHTPELEKQDSAVNPEDSNSTDEDQYQLNVDMKVSLTLASLCRSFMKE